LVNVVLFIPMRKLLWHRYQVAAYPTIVAGQTTTYIVSKKVEELEMSR
jgi:putative flippase GtrA